MIAAWGVAVFMMPACHRTGIDAGDDHRREGPDPERVLGEPNVSGSNAWNTTAPAYTVTLTCEDVGHQRDAGEIQRARALNRFSRMRDRLHAGFVVEGHEEPASMIRTQACSSQWAMPSGRAPWPASPTMCSERCSSEESRRQSRSSLRCVRPGSSPACPSGGARTTRRPRRSGRSRERSRSSRVVSSEILSFAPQAEDRWPPGRPSARRTLVRLGVYRQLTFERGGRIDVEQQRHHERVGDGALKWVSRRRRSGQLDSLDSCRKLRSSFRQITR